MRLKGKALEARRKVVDAHFDELIRVHGWASHCVPLDNLHMNYHTHGVEMNYKHLDFQITFNIAMQTAHIIVGNLIAEVKDGRTFEEGMTVTGFLQGDYKLGFKKYMECGRDVLRVLIPDSNNFLPTDERCHKDYKSQLDVLTD